MPGGLQHADGARTVAVGATDITTYYHNDVSGTPLLATDTAGAVIWKENYRPYGGKLNQPAAAAGNGIGFAGHPYDNSSGLSYQGARYYDPVLGRFTGIDPKEADPQGLHSLNRYAYGNNNPYKYVDPDGRAAQAVAGGVLILGLGYTICDSCRKSISSGLDVVVRGLKGLLHSEARDEDGGAPASGSGKSPEITPQDLGGKTQGEIEDFARAKGLVQDPKKPNKWRDPETGKERLRIDSGHVDPTTGKPYDNPNAAQPHVHGYDPSGKNKIRDPATNDPHFPLSPTGGGQGS